MSLKQLIRPGVKPWLNSNAFSQYTNDGLVMESLTEAKINTTGAITSANIIGGIVTSTTGAAVVATFASGEAKTLYELMGSPDTGASFNLLVVNLGGANTFTLASSDANLSVAGMANSAAVAANTSRNLKVVVTNSATPALKIYG